MPKTLRHVSISGVIVGVEHHAQFAAATERGLHTAEAGNVGIRRARGRFVTPKASDTYFSPDVIAMIARRNLDADTMYRITRHDIEIDDEFILDLDDDALFAKLASLPANPHSLIRQMPFWDLRDLHTNACGDFTLMSAAHWHLLRGHPRTSVLSLDIDSLVMHAAAAQGVTECRWPDSCRVFKPSHGKIATVRVQQIWRPWQRRLDKFLSEKVSETAAHRSRTWLNYPRRIVHGVDSLVGPSIERNFVQPASRWALGGYSADPAGKLGTGMRRWQNVSLPGRMADRQVRQPQLSAAARPFSGRPRLGYEKLPTAVDRHHRFHDGAGKGPRSLAAAFVSASTGVRMPGMVQASAANDRQKRNALLSALAAWTCRRPPPEVRRRRRPSCRAVPATTPAGGRRAETRHRGRSRPTESQNKAVCAR